MNYLVYVTKQICAASSVPELRDRRRKILLYNPKISSFISNQNNIG